MTQLHHSFYPTDMGKLTSFMGPTPSILSTPVTTTTSQAGQLMLSSSHPGIQTPHFDSIKPPPSLELSLSALKSVFEPEGPSYSKRIPNCQKCGQHQVKNRLKGHKRSCPFKDCECAKCQVVSERQKLMADQIKIRRRQRKDTQSACVRDHLQNLTAALNASAAMNFPVNNLNNIQAALLYNLKNSVPSSLLTSPASSDGSSYSPIAINSFNSSPDLIKNSGGTAMNGPTLILQASNPPSPQGILAPVAINPLPAPQPTTITPTSVDNVASAFSFPPLFSNPNDIWRLLASYNLFDQLPKFDEPLEMANIDVCTV